MRKWNKRIALLLIMAMVSWTFNINFMSISFADTHTDYTDTQSGGTEDLSTTSSATNVTTGAATTIPVIESTTPVNEGTDVSLNEVIKITFDQAVKIVEPTNEFGVQLTTGIYPEEISLVKMGIDLIELNPENDHEIIFKINEYLEAGKSYQIWLDECIEGTVGGKKFTPSIAEPIIIFATSAEATIPVIESTTPVNEGTDVSLNEVIKITFDQAVKIVEPTNEFGVQLTTGIYPEEISLVKMGIDLIELNPENDHEIIFKINEYLEAGKSYQIWLDECIEGTVGGKKFTPSIAEPIITFTTAAEATIPVIESTTPVSEGTDVSLNEVIKITFDQAVKIVEPTNEFGVQLTTGIYPEEISLVKMGIDLIELNPENDHEIIFKINEYLEAGKSYQIWLDECIEGTVGGKKFTPSIAEPIIIFATSAEATIPVIESTTPVNEGTDVSLNEVIKITFDQAVKIVEPTNEFGVQLTTGIYPEEISLVKMGIDLIELNPENDHEIIFKINEYLEAGKSYQIWLDECIEGTVGGKKFTPSIAEPIIIFATSAEATIPVIESTTPVNEGTDVSLNEVIKITFDQAVKIVEPTNEFGVQLTTGIYPEEISLVKMGIDLIELNPENDHEIIFKINEYLEAGKSYQIWLDECIEGTVGGKKFTPSIAEPIIIFATSAEATIPVIESTTPVNEGTDVSLNEVIKITFDQAVKIVEPTNEFGVQLTTGIYPEEISLVKMGIDLIELNPENDHEIIFKINEYLEAGKSYQIWLDECIEGTVGGKKFTPSIAEPIITFTTAAESLIESQTPENNSSVLKTQEFSITMKKAISEEYYNTLSLELYEKNDEVETLIKEGSGTDLINLEQTEKKKITFLINDWIIENKNYVLRVNKSNGEDNQVITEILFSVEIKNLAGCKLSNHKIIKREDVYQETFTGAVVRDGIIYAPRQVASGVGTWFFAFDLYGTELWKLVLDDIKVFAESKPVVDSDGTAYIQGTVPSTHIIDKTVVYAITREGTIKWKYTIDEHCGGTRSPKIYGDDLIVPLNKGVASLDLTNDGSLNWCYFDDELTGVGEPLVGEDGTIAYVTNNNSGSKNQIIGVKDGNVVWRYDDVNVSSYALCIKDGKTLYTVDDEGKIVALDIKTGEVDLEDLLNRISLLKDDEELDNIGSILYSSAGYLYISGTFLIDDDSIYRVYCIDSNGNIISTTDNEMDPISIKAVDDYGYGYYEMNGDGLAGTMAIYAMDIYGDIADVVPGFGSSITSYSSFFIEGNVFVGARKSGGDIQIIKISREQDEIPKDIEFIYPDKKYGLFLTEGVPLRTVNNDDKDMIVDQIDLISRDESIAMITDNNLYGSSEGNVDITAKITGTDIEKTDSISIVRKPSKITSVELSPKNTSIDYLDTLQFTGKVFDQYGEEMDSEVIWNCMINFKQAINSEGLFTAIGEGKYTLDLTSKEDSTVTTSTEVTITRDKSVFSGFSPNISVISPGVTQRFSTVNQYGESFEGESIEWSTDDENIVEIDENGVVTAIKEGSAEIKAVMKLSNDSIVEKTKVIKVLEPLYEEFRISGYGMLDDTVEDENENIYFVEDHYKLVSFDKSGILRWEKNLGESISFIGLSENSGIYVLTALGDTRRIFLFSYDGDVVWSKIIDSASSYSLIKNPSIDENIIYMPYNKSKTSKIIGIDVKGDNVFEVNLNNSLTDFIIMPSKEIWTLDYESDNKETTLSQYDKMGNLLGSKTFESGFKIGETAGVSVVDENGRCYSYYSEPSEKDNGICCFSKDGIIWSYSFGYNRGNSESFNVIYDGENVYVTDKGSNRSILYALNTEGELQWQINLSDMGGNGNTISTTGDIEFRNGNLYVPCFEDESSVSGIIDDKILLIIIDAKTGTVKRYNQFISDDYVDSTEVVDYLSKNGFIEFGKNSIYLNLQGFVTLKGATKSKDYDYVVKFSETTDEERVPTKISITGAPSVGIDRKVNLTATLYDQYGGIVKDKAIKWSSKNENIAKIDDNGTVTGIAKGDTTISAYIEDYDLSQTYEINVYPLGANNVSPEEISEKIKETC